VVGKQNAGDVTSQRGVAFNPRIGLEGFIESSLVVVDEVAECFDTSMQAGMLESSVVACIANNNKHVTMHID
jgi:hypothetical protein